MEGFSGLSPQWAWLALGLTLAAAEIAAPGFFLIWLAAAALITGFIVWVVPLGVPMQVVVFAVLAFALVIVARRWVRSNPVESPDPAMNDRGARLIGETVLVTQTIEGGTGRVKHGDTEWLAKGPDAAPGTRLRVSGHDGAVLLVEHLQ